MDKNKLALLCIEGSITHGGRIILTKGKVYFSDPRMGDHYLICADAGGISFVYKRRFKELKKVVS